MLGVLVDIIKSLGQFLPALLLLVLAIGSGVLSSIVMILPMLLGTD